ncbi:MAG: tetratricopeptide repeat protein, partial [Clostridium sp.]
MKKFKLGLNKMFKKVTQGYSNINKKSPYIEPFVVISASLLVSIIVIISVTSVLKEDKVIIESNKAEVAFYNGNYDVAIAEYEKLQENETWPFWQVKIAEIYSIKGNIDKSNELLVDAVNKRNKIIYNKDGEKYADKDKDFMNYVIFTYFMNEEYEEALSLGELFIKENGADKVLKRTMYTVYMANGQNDKASEIIDTYEVDEDSSYDIALLAKMNMLNNNWDNGFKLL